MRCVRDTLNDTHTNLFEYTHQSLHWNKLPDLQGFIRMLEEKCAMQTPVLVTRWWWGFADEKGRFDEVVEEGGVRILIEPAALMHVIGTTMDFVEDRIKCAGFQSDSSHSRCSQSMCFFSQCVLSAKSLSCLPPGAIKLARNGLANLIAQARPGFALWTVRRDALMDSLRAHVR